MLNVVRYALLTVALWVLVLDGPAWAWSPTNMFSSGNSASNGKSTKKTGSNRRAANKPGVVDTLTAAPKKLYANTKSLVCAEQEARSADPPAIRHLEQLYAQAAEQPEALGHQGLVGA